MIFLTPAAGCQDTKHTTKQALRSAPFFAPQMLDHPALYPLRIQSRSAALCTKRALRFYVRVACGFYFERRWPKPFSLGIHESNRDCGRLVGKKAAPSDYFYPLLAQGISRRAAKSLRSMIYYRAIMPCAVVYPCRVRQLLHLHIILAIRD